MKRHTPESKPQDGDHRRHQRRTVLIAGRLLCGEASLPCEVINVSAGGAKLRTSGAFTPGQELCLEMDLCGQFPGVAAWVSGDELGLTFTGDPERVAEALIGLATYG